MMFYKEKKKSLLKQIKDFKLGSKKLEEMSMVVE